MIYHLSYLVTIVIAYHLRDCSTEWGEGGSKQFSMVTLSRIFESIQNSSKVFSTSICHTSLKSTFLWPFKLDQGQLTLLGSIQNFTGCSPHLRQVWCWPFKYVKVILACQHYYLRNIWILLQLYRNVLHIKILDKFNVDLSVTYQTRSQPSCYDILRNAKCKTIGIFSTSISHMSLMLTLL